MSEIDGHEQYEERYLKNIAEPAGFTPNSFIQITRPMMEESWFAKMGELFGIQFAHLGFVP